MSQYPTPYQPPAPVSQYMSVPIASSGPAKKAGLLMLIIGPLMLLFGGCMVSLPAMMNQVHTPEMQQMRERVKAETGSTPEQQAPLMGVVIGVPGICLSILGVFVRRGSQVASILSTIVVGLILLVVVCMTLGGLFRPVDLQMVSGSCLMMICLAVFAMMMFWLIQVLRRPNGASAEQQYAAQYWQYQQMMQAYGGYPPPAAPIPPPQGYAAPPMPYAATPPVERPPTE